MINIRVLNSFFIVFSLYSYDIELRIPDVSDEHLNYIQQLNISYPGKTMKIEVIPETTFFEKIKNSLTGNENTELKGQGDLFSTKKVALYFIKSCFGVTAVSYFSVAYVIYRAYKIAQKIKLWFKEDDNQEETNTMDDIERMLFKKKSYLLSPSDEKWLSYYVRLNAYLKTKGLRAYFIKNKQLDKLILAYQQS